MASDCDFFRKELLKECLHGNEAKGVAIIAKHISARHWIANCGPGIGSCMYVCMYAYPSRFWNAIKAQRMHDGNIFLSLCACVCMHACTAAYVPVPGL